MKKLSLLEQGNSELKYFEKTAEALSPHAKEYLKSLLKPALGTLAAISAAGGIRYMLAKKEREEHDKAIANSFSNTFGRDESFQKSPGDFSERFNELSMISPTIAKNPGIASKLISKKIKSGFDIDDLHKLTAIENNATTARRVVSPSAAGRAAALSAFGSIFNVLGPTALHDMRAARNTFLEKDREFHQSPFIPNPDEYVTPPPEFVDALRNSGVMEDLLRRAHEHNKGKKGDDMEKKSSARQVSDECLGQLLSDRYNMVKEAGLLDSLKPGATALKQSLLFMAPALALGGGIQLVSQALESHRNAQLQNQADNIFKKLRTTSDVVKGDPETAMEAFETLKAIAPSLASRPQVARTFIENVVRQGQIAPDTVSAIADAENKVRGLGSAGRGGFGSGFKSTMDLMGGKPKHSELASIFNKRKSE